MDYKNELTLDLLPYDCLEYIFSKMDLKSQIQVSRICSNFQNICTGIWRRSAEYQFLQCEDLMAFDLSTDDLSFFLRIIKTFVTKVTLSTYFLHDFLKQLYDVLKIDVLPNVLWFDADYFLDHVVSDDDIFMLAQIMPNLTTLKLMPAITGRNLKLFENLQELHLYHDCEKEYELKNSNLPDIFDSLKNLRVLDIRSFELSNLDICTIYKCQQLEVLKLNLNVLKPVLDDVLSLPKLKTLTVLLDHVIIVNLVENVDNYDYKIYETYEFYYILEHMDERITGIAVDNYFMPLTRQWDDDLDIFKYNKLTKFAFCNYVYLDDMLVKYTSMRELRFLCCRNWSELTNETVLKLVVACTKLEHLDITYCGGINEDFLHGAARALRAQGKRKPLLTVYYSMTGIKDAIKDHPSYADWTSVMNLSTDFPPNSDRGLSYIQRGYEFDFD